MKYHLTLIASSAKAAGNVKMQLEELIGKYVEISALHYEQLKYHGLIEDQLVLITAPSFAHLITPYLKPGTRYLLARRNINAKYINRLLEIPPGAEVLVVNDFITGTYELIYELLELDLHPMKLFPFDPSLEENPYGLKTKPPNPKLKALREAFTEKDMARYLNSYKIPPYSGKPFEYAITAGEVELVPPGIKKIIDLCDREISILTVAEILYNLTGSIAYDNLVVSRFQRGTIQLNYQLQKQSIEYQALKERLSAVIANTNQGIIMVDGNNIVRLSNKLAHELLDTADLTNQNLSDILSPDDMALLSTTDFFRINEHEVYAERIPVPLTNDPNSYMLILEPVDKIQDIDERYRRKARAGHRAKYHFKHLIYQSTKMKNLVAKAKAFAVSDATILITGESGTGKELLAQAIHNASPRQNAPFIAINCSSLTESLLESELFGYEEGAFTGAKKGGKKGILELAHTGTLFLDEIGDAPPSIQAGLLRCIQEKEVWRVGGNRPIPIDVRIIAATNQDLYKLVLAGKFRQDLYYRLNVLLLKIPPLRERREDIPLLINYFMSPSAWLKHAAFVQQKDVMDLLTAYHWPGNVRQLENVVEFLESSPSSETLLEDLRQLLNMGQDKPASATPPASLPSAASDVKEELLTPYYPSPLFKEHCLHLLNLLYEARKKEICSLSRRELKEHLKKMSVNLTPQQIKNRLEHLKKYGLIDSKTGCGTWITQEGEEYLKRFQK